MYTLYESPSLLTYKTFEDGTPPLVSIYLHTHRGSAEMKQDKLMFKNLVMEAERSLKQRYEKRSYSNIIENLEALYENPNEDLWRNLKDGLAVLASHDDLHVCLLDYAVQNQSIVADSFHIKPLIRGFQFDTTYYLLELNKEKFELYYGNSQGFKKVVLPEDMENIYENVFPVQDKDALLNVGSYGGLEPSYHGHKSKSDLLNTEREKFFRYTDKMVSSILTEDTKVPVILVALTQYQSEYHSLSTLEGLLPKGIDKRLTSTSDQDFLKEVAALVSDAQKKTLTTMVSDFSGARAAGKATADPSEIAAALVEQKVRVLFLDEDSITPGYFDLTTGSLSFEDSENPEVDDLGDDFAQATYKQGGKVYILSHEEMPADTGMAAFFRY